MLLGESVEGVESGRRSSRGKFYHGRGAGWLGVFEGSSFALGEKFKINYIETIKLNAKGLVWVGLGFSGCV